MAAGRTYTPIATTTISGSSVATVDFTSISGSYTDLVVVCSIRGTQATSTVTLLQVCNANRGNLYDGITLKGDGTSATSARYNYTDGTWYYAPMGLVPAASTTSGTFSSQIINCNNYSNTTTYKTFIARSGAAGYETQAIVNMFFQTPAISRLTYYLSEIGRAHV